MSSMGKFLLAALIAFMFLLTACGRQASDYEATGGSFIYLANDTEHETVKPLDTIPNDKTLPTSNCPILDTFASFILSHHTPIYDIYYGEAVSDISRFAIVDMNGDGVPEIILEHFIIGHGFPHARTVLHYYNGEIYSHWFTTRGMQGLRKGGTFTIGGGAGWTTLSQLAFASGESQIIALAHSETAPIYDGAWEMKGLYFINNQPACEESFHHLLNAHFEKEYAEWHTFHWDSIHVDFIAPWEYEWTGDTWSQISEEFIPIYAVENN
ncbi:MAG: hypothetical protein FWC16_02930 [Defluviitaleaceae bacterium]|nr:hypothetical protein [Defluviitaleaceae bacterium]MCL2273855.1 hypothetical protein [Defluviitaleaceae bacterium]